MKNNRIIAYDALSRVLLQGAYSNLALDQALRREGLPREQSAFVTALFYGVLELGPRLDYQMNAYLKKPAASLDPEIRIILQIGFYQLLYMDSVPDRAAVDESVRLAGYARKSSARGLVNGVLRSFLRDGRRERLPDPASPEYPEVRYACPGWIFSQWTAQYGPETAARLAEASLGRPPLSVRVNTLKTTSEALARSLGARGIAVRPHAWLRDCLLLEGTGSIDGLPEYREGLFHVQDVSSQLSGLALGALPGEKVVDLCAAPGSKSFVAAQTMEGRGRILSCDLHPRKAGLIAKGAERLGIGCLEALCRDGREYDPALGGADRVLCDAPCSGLGILRRKPEIKYRPPREALPALQRALLENAARYVKPGGRLVYSTCTTNRAENEEVARLLLSQNFRPFPLQSLGIFSKIDPMGLCDGVGVTLFPHQMEGDAFYISAFVRV